MAKIDRGLESANLAAKEVVVDGNGPEYRYSSKGSLGSRELMVEDAMDNEEGLESMDLVVEAMDNENRKR